MARLAAVGVFALIAAAVAAAAEEGVCRADGGCASDDGEEASALLQHAAASRASRRWCLSDMTPCNNETACCGQCVEGKVGGMNTGICANNGTFNYSSPECIPADAPCSSDMDCCGVCKVDGSDTTAPRRAPIGTNGTCKVQDTWSQTCLPKGDGCGGGLDCCKGKCVYMGAGTQVCCDNPVTVSGGAWTVCCDDPSQNTQWCGEGASEHVTVEEVIEDQLAEADV